MFERRLKILLTLIVVFTVAVALRSAQIQLLEHSDWIDEASGMGQNSQFVEATRGRILDINGREIALDAPCSDVCVRYAAILGAFESTEDKTWLRQTAAARVERRLGDDYDRLSKAQRKAALDAEIEKVRGEIRAMWPTLAKLSGKGLEEIEEARQAIVQRVEMRRRYLWHLNFETARQKKEDGANDAGWLARWLTETGPGASQIDKFDMVIGEQREAHPILKDVDANVSNYLMKNAGQFPGLIVRRSTVRHYPYGDVAAHVIGHLAKVTREDLKANAAMTGPESELKRYWVNDDIGRTGLEALAETALRGTRGKIGPAPQEEQGEREVLEVVPGKDVKTTIDIELQKDVQALFKHVKLSQKDSAGHEYNATAEMNGAAVVVDVETGEVRALVSYPSFDLNRYQEEFAALNADELRRPFLNRATQMALEPGSTVKPMVGIAAITEGAWGVNDTVECSGWLVINGRRYGVGRCWTAKFAIAQGMHSIHHYGLSDGRLAFSDALKFSCNVYFETMADKLGIDRLAHYYDLFGLGRATGIGIDEKTGRVPDGRGLPRDVVKPVTWFSGIGQTQVLATPVQMANVAATIARGGVWMRPRLVTGVDLSQKLTGPDMVDLHLSPVALAAAREGMRRVVNDPHGTAFASAHNDDVLVAGKTGTAQAAPFSYPKRNDRGELMYDADRKMVRETLAASTFEKVNPQAPWYWAWGSDFTDLSHAWFVGFAPADNPKLAFAVMVEYGGGGGATAGRLASDVIESCVRHGYLPSKTRGGERANVAVGN